MDKIRNGKFTSSTIVGLVSKGKEKGSVGAPFNTLVKQKRQERKLGRSLETDSKARSMTWGSFVEMWLMYERPDIIGLEYTLTPKSTKAHPKFEDIWVGSKDGHNNNTKAIIDLKCPFTLTSFCDFADCKNIEEVRKNHKDGEKYYWQIVSNACIDGLTKGELIIYVPTLEELMAIQKYAYDGNFEKHPTYEGNAKDFYFISMADEQELPYIELEKSDYKNVLRFAFDITQEDIDFLTGRVEMAGKLLLN